VQKHEFQTDKEKYFAPLQEPMCLLLQYNLPHICTI